MMHAGKIRRPKGLIPEVLSGQPVRIYRADHNLGYAGGVNVTIRQLLRSFFSQLETRET